MKKIIFLLVFPFLLNAQNTTEPLKKDSVRTNNIPPLDRSKDEAKQLIEALRERVLKGEDMSALASQYSEDPGSAKKGGQLSPYIILVQSTFLLMRMLLQFRSLPVTFFLDEKSNQKNQGNPIPCTKPLA